MDLNTLYYRQQVSMMRADSAASGASRKAHLGLAQRYLEVIACYSRRVRLRPAVLLRIGDPKLAGSRQ